jgi:hypothetical protein
MVQNPGRPALGEGKSLKMTVLVEQGMLTALDLVMQEMRDTMPGVRIDRSTAVRYLLSKALTPYVRPSEAPVTLGEDQSTDFQDSLGPQTANTKDHERTTGRTGRKRTAAKG